MASSELLGQRPGSGAGYQVLVTFNASYRAREFMQFLKYAKDSHLQERQNLTNWELAHLLLLHHARKGCVLARLAPCVRPEP